MKILFLAGFLTLGVIYSEKILGSIGHLQKLCKLFPQALIYLKSAMLNMQANAGSEQQNCSHSMLKLARDLKVGPLDCIWSALHTEPNFVFVPLYMKIFKYTSSFSS